MSNKIKLYNYIMTIGIVIYHWKYSYLNRGGEYYVYQFFDLLGYIAVGYFFTMSGFLFYRGVNNYFDVLAKMKRRIHSLCIPFVVWNCFGFIWTIFLSHDNQIKLDKIIKGFTYEPYVGPLWYVFALILLTLMAPILYIWYKQSKDMKFTVGVLLILSSLVLYYLTSLNEGFWWFTRLLGYLPNYFIGIMLAGISEKQKSMPWIRFFCMGYFIFVVLMYSGIISIKLPFILSRALLVILPLAVWFCVPSSAINFKPCKFMSVTFFIFAMHQTFLIPVMDKIERMLLIPQFNSAYALIYFVFKIVVLVFGTTVFAVILKRINNKLYRVLSGGRG